MICPNCNSENQEGSLFCNKCGANLSVNGNERKGEGLKPRINFLRNKNRVLIVSLVTLIAVSFVSFLIYFQNPMNQFKREIRNNNYSDAMIIFNKKLKGNSEKENQVRSFLEDELTKTKKLYVDNSLDFTKANSRLETIKNTGLLIDEVNAAKTDIENINNSRISYKKALEFEKGKDYIEAIREYKKVIKEDDNFLSAQKHIDGIAKSYKEDVLKNAKKSAKEKNYDKSVSLLKEASDVLTNDSDIIAKLSVYEKQLEEKNAAEKQKDIVKAMAEQLVEVESAKITVQDPQYKALYPDMIQVIVNNKSEKTIKNMQVGALGFDNNGYPLKIKTQLSLSGGDYEFVGNAEDVNIVAGGRFGDNVGWDLDENHGISKVLACVKNVTFYDGSRWDNPYYQYWLDEYKEKPLH